MAPCNQRRSTVSADLGSVAPAAKIAKKKKGVRSNGKLHVDFDSSIREPIGRTCFTFFTAIGTIVTRHAPRNVRKWDDIPEEKIQALIDRVLSMFDVDISIPYVKDWVLWRMKLRFRCIKQERATQKAQNAEIMKLMSKLAIGSSFDMDLEVDSTCSVLNEQCGLEHLASMIAEISTGHLSLGPLAIGNSFAPIGESLYLAHQCSLGGHWPFETHLLLSGSLCFCTSVQSRGPLAI
ncbi:hypothetical protein LWI29_034177 [Acer saccharum]|uniref:Uncharacterized protein n=1 Tax=Acer saccharum TaxID=4024 RepID=A0AA39TXU8_ACESA|nr:hypothetical protein LWI29_034177 [Acer saccharum]